MPNNYISKNNYIETGRGSTAIYLTFLNEGLCDSDVLVPGNICYAAIFPIVFSGNKPVFCDVNLEDGNVCLDELKKRKTANTKAVLVAHMYGNAIVDLEEIKEWCTKNNILLIEDCASSYGSKNNKYGYVGSLGDYVIYSFGYSKIIDLGIGGLLCSDRDLSIAKIEYEKLEEYDDKVELIDQDISTTYRRVRNGLCSYDELRNKDFHKQLIFYKDMSGLINRVGSMQEMSICSHKDKYQIYENLVEKRYKRQRLNNGSVPWRFSLLVDEYKRKTIISELLSAHLPVSDWYPNVTEFFNNEKICLDNVDKTEKLILNFPLDIEEDVIRRICCKINVL